MNRYANCFRELEKSTAKAFVPFVVIGDPDLATSQRIIDTLASSGADALELGFPFSDPLADGPVIQNAMDRALLAQVTPQHCLELIGDFRKTNPTIPIGLLVYANIVYAFGINEFYQACHAAGVDSVLVADVPVCESGPFCDAAQQAGIDPILLCPPNIDSETIEKISRLGSGYTYLLSRAGVTGTNVAAGRPVGDLLDQLKQHAAPPPVLGFGISTPQHVTEAIESGAHGV
ncbi:MAG: tryptophan synthase subunit alpha, partial [Pirellulaceae bacterium]|nr:tryptophan synthase subunit alpha [Pirellulaceae bacterium]